MNKKYFIAVCCKNCGKQWAYVMTINGNENLIGIFDGYPSRSTAILSANICDSKKEAFRIIDMWNNEFKKAGVYAY